MAETTHAFLKANGNLIQGESTQTTHGCEGSIECVSYEHSVHAPHEHGTMRPTGRREHSAIVILKRIDAASPLLLKACCEHQRIDGHFKFYRPDPAGTGATQQYYTVHIEDARIQTIHKVSPNVLQAGASRTPPLEEVSFVFPKITETFEVNGVTHEDSWAGRC